MGALNEKRCKNGANVIIDESMSDTENTPEMIARKQLSK